MNEWHGWDERPSDGTRITVRYDGSDEQKSGTYWAAFGAVEFDDKSILHVRRRRDCQWVEEVGE